MINDAGKYEVKKSRRGATRTGRTAVPNSPAAAVRPNVVRPSRMPSAIPRHRGASR